MKKKMKKASEGYVGFDTSDLGMDNRGEYIRIPVKKKEIVDHPEHYTQGIEVIDFIDSWDFNFTTGNIIKYVSRHNLKGDPVGDLKKARWYLDRLICFYEKEEK